MKIGSKDIRVMTDFDLIEFQWDALFSGKPKSMAIKMAFVPANEANAIMMG